MNLKIDFEDDILVRKMTLYFLSFVSVLLIVDISLNFLTNRLYFIKPAFVQENMIKSDVCLLGLKSILDKKPYKELLTEGNYQALIKSNFTIFDIENVHAYNRPVVEGNTCTISAKNDQGLLSFKIKLIEGGPFGLIIADVEEIETSLTERGK